MSRRRRSVWMSYTTWRTWWQDVRLAWALLRDPRVPLWTKVLLPLAWVLYLLMPLDVLPDFFPLLGEIDDLMLFLFLVRLFIHLSPPDVVADVRERLQRGRRPQVIEGRYRVIEEP